MDFIHYATVFVMGVIIGLTVTLTFAAWVRDTLQEAIWREERARLIYQKALEEKFGPQ